jgi:uncharacterized protein YgbK (DUF1537 family)
MERINQLVDAGTEILLFDTVDQEHLLKIGQLIWSLERDARFIVASSGLEYALTANWQRSGLIERPEPISSIGPVSPLAVITGSAAPQTAAQIEWAIEHNFHGIRLDAAGLIDSQTADTVRHAALQEAVQVLNEGRSVILFSTIGPTDEAITATRNRIQQLGFDPHEVGSRLGAQQGMLLRELLARTKLRRVCVAGGDTCGHVINQLDIFALEYLMPIAPGSPLCRARSEIQQFDGLEISLKAGQVGKADYFGRIQNGEVFS